MCDVQVNGLTKVLSKMSVGDSFAPLGLALVFCPLKLFCF